MIDLYYWTTPNGHKITIFLEEVNMPYKLIPINIGTGEQFAPDFLKISPNNRIPAIVDHHPKGGDMPLSLFESGAILDYLADKSGQFGGKDLYQRAKVMEWLMWQMGGFGPMLGQNHHFSTYAPEKVPYAINRYQKETERLYGVLDRALAESAYIAGDDYTIADMAIYPWAVPHTRQNIDLVDYKHVGRWFEMIRARPAVMRAYDLVDKVNPVRGFTDEQKKVLFNQGRDPQANLKK